VNGTTDDFLALFNEIVDNIKYFYDISCMIGCDACYEDKYGIYSKEFHEDYKAVVGQGLIFTLDEIRALDLDAPSIKFEDGYFCGFRCFVYTTDGEGKACFNWDWKGISGSFIRFDNYTIMNNT